MALAGKQQVDLELNSPADKFYSMVKTQTHHLPNVSSDKVHGVELHEGDWDSHGSIKLWKFSADGKVETLKEKVEIDEEKRSISFTAIEGDLLDHYKSYKCTLRVTPKPEDKCLVNINVDYEKLNESVPPPKKYMDFVVGVIKDIDAHLAQSQLLSMQ